MKINMQMRYDGPYKLSAYGYKRTASGRHYKNLPSENKWILYTAGWGHPALHDKLCQMAYRYTIIFSIYCRAG